MRKLIVAALMLLVLPVAVGASSSEPVLRAFKRGSWDQLRKAHAGQATIVHFWGLTCGPCLAELPKWASAAKARSGLPLVLIDASPFGDDPGNAWTALEQNGLTGVENWIFADSFEERLRFEIDPRWHGEMPYTLLIGRDGTVSVMTGLTDFAKLDAWLDAQAKARS